MTAISVQRPTGKLLRWTLAGACGLSAMSVALAYAQDAGDDAAEYTDEIVVVGTPGGAGTNRLEASFAVTTLKADDITKFSPKSTADLFKAIPGVWAESSGGVAGANIDVRGLPGGSDAPFVTLAINGSPIYGTEMLSFFEQSSIFRVDETIEGVEGLRGGPNAVFGKGEPGLTVNFNLKEGGDDLEGLLKYSTSDYGLQRVDAVVSGPLAEDFYFMVGGYYKASDGIRDTQFTSEEGHQVTLNLTKNFSRGKLNAFIRETDDHGQWILPMALNTGNDLGEFAQLGNATRFRTLRVNAAGDTKEFDFADGRGWDGIVAGGSFNYDLSDNISFRDQLTYTNGDADTFGLVPDGGPVTAGDLAAVIGGPVTTAGGDTLASGDYVQNYGHWVVMKDLKSFINDASVNVDLGDHNFTLGYYRANWESVDFWTLGNFTPVQNVANGDFLDSAIGCGDLATAGSGSGCWAFGLDSTGKARTQAAYFADSWQITDQFRLDAGARREWINLDYYLNTGPGYPDDVLDSNAVNHLNDSQWAYTFAGNYDVYDDLGVFIRYSKGFLFPHFDDIRENNLNVNGVKQLEGGVKYVGDWLTLFGTVFYNKNDSFLSVVGSSVAASAFKTRAIGVELDGTVSYGPFATQVTATIQDAEIRDSTTASDIGNKVLRQPDFQARISPSYTLEAGGFEATLYGAATFVGDRFGDNANSVTLPSYRKLDLGVIVNTDSGVFFQVHADNLNDSHGITEGDPRNPSAPNGRPILGRSVLFSIGYNFQPR